MPAVSYVVTPAPDGVVNFTGTSAGCFDGAVFDADFEDSILCESEGPPPVVIAVGVAEGAAQRSMVKSLTYQFSADVSGTLDVADLSLVKLNTLTNVDELDMAFTYDPGTDTATWTFPGNLGGTLLDGNYYATLLAAGITDTAGNLLDGNNGGTCGDNHFFDFFRYFGDGDGDRDVDFLNLFEFGLTFPVAPDDPNYDFRFDQDSDEDVDSLDLINFRVRFPSQLAPVPVPCNETEATFNVGNGPYGVAFDGANIWVTTSYSDIVTKLRVSDGVVQGSFPVGATPLGVAFDGANIWVTNGDDNTVTKLRASDGDLQGTFNVGSKPYGVAFDGANIWVASFDDNTVTKL